MHKLTRADLLSLEAYAEQRPTFRARVLQHKRNRQLALGDHVTLLFEDRLTIQYQIQEMLRVERIFEPSAIADELAAYNPLIPDGSNLKATLLIEYADVSERHAALARLIGIEDKVWLQVADHEPVWAIADDDMARETQDKTAAVHFLRFEFSLAMTGAFKAGATLAAGIDHPAYPVRMDRVASAVCEALRADFD